MGTLRDRFPLRRRKILKKCVPPLMKVGGFAVVGSVLFFWLLALNDEPGAAGVFSPDSGINYDHPAVWIWLLVMLLILSWPVLIQYLYFRFYFYDADKNNFVLRKGVVKKKEITLPFSKITDVYVDQDFADVVLGLYDVYISTPTVESGSFAHIDGVDKATSVELKKFILGRVNERPNEAP